MWPSRTCPPKPTLTEPIDQHPTWQMLQAIRKLHKYQRWQAKYQEDEASRAAAHGVATHLASTLKHHPLRDDLLRDWKQFGADAEDQA